MKRRHPLKGVFAQSAVVRPSNVGICDLRCHWHVCVCVDASNALGIVQSHSSASPPYIVAIAGRGNEAICISGVISTEYRGLTNPFSKSFGTRAGIWNPHLPPSPDPACSRCPLLTMQQGLGCAILLRPQSTPPSWSSQIQWWAQQPTSRPAFVSEFRVPTLNTDWLVKGVHQKQQQASMDSLARGKEESLRGLQRAVYRRVAQEHRGVCRGMNSCLL